MFNTITASILNRFLGDYLDISDLDVSLWEGSFILNNIAIKSTAFHAFQLPYHVVAGNVGKLDVKLPWRTIYTNPVEVVLTDVHLVVIASKNVPYDHQAEEAEFLNYKLTHLKFLEEKEKELEEKQGTTSTDADAATSGQQQVTAAQQPLSFSENLVAAIKRNLYVRIESVHVRFEDNSGIGYTPFSAGIVLSSLTLETTNDKGVRTFIPEDLPTIYKMLNLRGFGVYLNCGDNITTNGVPNPIGEDKEEIVRELAAFVNNAAEDDDHKLNYIIGPIVSSVLSAEIRIIPHPEQSTLPFSIPKTVVEMNANKFYIAMSSVQFMNLIRLSMRITEVSGSSAKTWRKFRPLVNQYKGHYKEWWNFAIQCILFSVKRKRDNWKWKNFKDHIESCKKYTDALVRLMLSDTYSNSFRKLTHRFLPILSGPDEEFVRKSEAQLNILSLILCRKKAQLKAERQEAFGTKHKSGFLSFLHNWKIVENNSEELQQYLNQPWTHEEKLKIILAADFCDSEEPPPDPGSKLIYPISYVGFRAVIHAKEINCTVNEYQTSADSDGDQILQVKIVNLLKCFETRPASNGFKLDLKMRSIIVTGQAKQATTRDDEDGNEPNYLFKATSMKPGQNVDICYEKFPLDSPAADDKLTMTFSANAIEILNHTSTVQRIAALVSRARYTPTNTVIMDKLHMLKKLL